MKLVEQQPVVIGLDFDNTIIDYDICIRNIARERNLVSDSVGGGKKQIRDAIRLLPQGEIEWQKIQGLVYGPRIMDASLSKGVRDFLKLCNTYELTVFVISHKTRFASYDDTRTDLRLSALDWMRSEGLFDPDISPLTEGQVFFGSTRDEKIGYIRKLGCTHFVDDLEETFLEESFPENVRKILYNPHKVATSCTDALQFSEWYRLWDVISSHDIC